MKELVAKYSKIAKKLADWLDINVAESLTVFAIPATASKNYEDL